MPTYEYRCEQGHTFETFQSMADDALDSCEVCGASAQRVLSAPAVHFKGSGFYTTDYARKGAKTKAGDGDGSDSKSEGGDSGASDGGGSSGSDGSSSSSGSSGSSDSSGSSGSSSGSSEKKASSGASSSGSSD